MICGIHQPQTWPWLGFFAKIYQSDIFVFLDNVQFKKQEYQNRNKLKYGQQARWFTVPVIHSFGQKINQVKINNRERWKHDHKQTLQTYYSKAEYFDKYYEEIKSIYDQNWELLYKFNLKTIYWLLEKLNISTKLYLASDLDTKQGEGQAPAEKLINIVKKVDADTYLSGQGGQDYLNTDNFKKSDITLKFQNFEHPKYNQLNPRFISHLSTLDLLLNQGPQSKNIILKGIK